MTFSSLPLPGLPGLFSVSPRYLHPAIRPLQVLQGVQSAYAALPQSVVQGEARPPRLDANLLGAERTSDAL